MAGPAVDGDVDACVDDIVDPAVPPCPVRHWHASAEIAVQSLIKSCVQLDPTRSPSTDTCTEEMSILRRQ